MSTQGNENELKDKEGEDSYLDPIVVKHILDAAIEVFSIQAATPVEFVTIASVPVQGKYDLYDVAAVQGMISSNLRGTLALCFPASTFIVVASRMMKTDFTVVTPENVDTAGEMLNIISGTVRRKISKIGYDFQPAIPNVISGKEMVLFPGETAGVLKVRGNTDIGPIFMELTMKKK